MIVFLTSSPTGALDGSYIVDGLDNRNGFVDQLRKVWKENARCLMITAFPEDYPASDEMTEFFHQATLKMDLTCSAYDLWDNRTTDFSEETLLSYDVIFLGGGHVPTQNAFFRRIDLRNKLRHFQGIIIGISAGSMNCADDVYSQPELPGESLDPNYKRWIKGLGLTDINILPHYQMIKDSYKDGKPLFRGITCLDSYGHKFLALCDGSYVLIKDGIATVYGEAYKLFPDAIMKACDQDHSLRV